ncbi:hypothetical protein, partial [Pseudomonas sp.]|uniref:hypothetical protein n=1 Tax=Pseudomonas sp. TaxID=306 RepID=UPI0028AB3996
LKHGGHRWRPTFRGQIKNGVHYLGQFGGLSGEGAGRTVTTLPRIYAFKPDGIFVNTKGWQTLTEQRCPQKLI